MHKNTKTGLSSGPKIKTAYIKQKNNLLLQNVNLSLLQNFAVTFVVQFSARENTIKATAYVCDSL